MLFPCVLLQGCKAVRTSTSLLLIYKKWLLSKAFNFLQPFVYFLFSPHCIKERICELIWPKQTHPTVLSQTKVPLRSTVTFTQENFSCERTARIGTLSTSYNFACRWNHYSFISRPSITYWFLLFSFKGKPHHLVSKTHCIRTSCLCRILLYL